MARYGSYRRFEVSVKTEATLPPGRRATAPLQLSDWTERLPANSRSTSQTCGCAFAISSRVGRSSSGSSQRVRPRCSPCGAGRSGIGILRRRRRPPSGPQGLLLAGDHILPEQAHPTEVRVCGSPPAGPRGGSPGRARRCGAPLDHHHLVDGEVAEERLTTIWLPPREGVRPGAAAAAGAVPGNSWKTLSTSPISSSANCPADIASAVGASSTSSPSIVTSISASSSASPA